VVLAFALHGPGALLRQGVVGKMNFYSYFVLSTLVVGGVVTHAYVAHEQFYPAVVHLSTDKMCLAVMYNFGFALFLLFGKVLLRMFIGTLRDLEVEQLVDSGRGFLADTILFLVFYAPTIDNREVGTVYLIQYICCVIFMKVFHLTTQIRVSHMFEVGIPRLIVNVKLVALMCLLLLCDVMALQYFYGVASRSSTFFTWILFEALTMSTVVLVSILKYSVHMVDLRLDNGWPGKLVCLFYIDLVHDVVSMTLFLVFMLTFFVQNPSRLPIYMMADIIQVARKLAQRLRSFRRYRRISMNMDMRFPDATDEEIEHDEHCVICRESLFDGSKPKKLPCNHIFHIDCLRSWLVMQQVCPTCRAEISPDGPMHAGAAAAVAAAAANAPDPPVAAADPADMAGAVDAAGQPEQVPEPRVGPTSAAAPDATGKDSPLPGAMASRPAAEPAAAVSPATAPHPSGGNRLGGAESRIPATTTTTPSATHAEPASKATQHSSASNVPEPPPHGAAAFAPGASPWSAPAAAASIAGAAGGGAISALPPVAEIVASLKHAEEVSKFLRQQTDFWMEQVRLIEQRSRDAAPPLRPDFLANPPASFGGAAVGGSGPASSPSSAPAPTSADGAASTNGGGGAFVDPLAEVRKLQEERWRRMNQGGSGGAPQ